jgi:hypothetical protein
MNVNVEDKSYSWKKFIANPNYNINAQLIIAFLTGLIFSPWSYGWLFFIIFLLVWEILYAISTECHPNQWILKERILIIVVSILGWMIGRIIVGYTNPFTNKRKKLYFY